MRNGQPTAGQRGWPVSNVSVIRFSLALGSHPDSCVSPKVPVDKKLSRLHTASRELPSPKSGRVEGGNAVATLYVRDMPNELYERLKKRATEEGRSISQEAVRLLRLALLTDRLKPDPEFKTWLDRV